MHTTRLLRRAARTTTMLGAASALLLAAACDSFIEPDPQDVLAPENFYKTSTDAIAAVNAVYEQNKWTHWLAYWFITDVATDDMFATANFGSDGHRLSNYTTDATEWVFGDLWGNSYRTINRANAVIGRVPAITMDETLKDRVLGEARFLRALSYFDLVRWFGDVPLLEQDTLRGLIDHHRSTGAALTALTAKVDRPKGYGRIIRDTDGSFLRIVEERDATDDERAIKEINAGVYAFELDGLFDSLRLIATGNSQAEYYLPDLVAIYRKQGRRVEAHEITGDPQQLLGVNSREELARMNAILRDKRNQAIMASGVTLIDPATTWIGADVVIGQDSVVHPNTYLEGATRIGANCEIHAGTRIVDSTLADNVIIQNYCVIRNSTVGAGATLGPFAHIRPDSAIGDQVHIGNFVELKKAKLGTGTKAGHLAYLGDATIGADVNIGAGVITCNYDGVKKHQTIIEDGVFVGTDSQLVAPVTVGKGAYVAAGSSITDDVPAGALAITRGRQIVKEGWADKKKKKTND
jgi:bifunctional UDP-N-acetylglucosamine pyrophosphorylase/glucosamine-1-phosphate N-acetyltransferase